MDRTIKPIKQNLAEHMLTLKSGRVLPMGVGCAYLGYSEPGYEGDPIERDQKLMEAAYETGFRMFDTSADYGKSEDVMGVFLKHIPRESIFLATKSPFPFREADGFERFKATFYKSFERLGVDHIDLYQIHDTDNYSACVREVIPFLRARRDEGLIDYIGMGTRSLPALSLGVMDGGLDSVLSYLECSILKTSARPLMKLTKEKGAGFINASTLHFGVVKAENPFEFRRSWNKDGLPFVGSELRIRQSADAMQKLLKKLGVPIISAALQISMLEPDMDITLNGIRRMSNLTSTLEALETRIEPEQWRQILGLRETLPMAGVQDNI